MSVIIQNLHPEEESDDIKYLRRQLKIKYLDHLPQVQELSDDCVSKHIHIPGNYSQLQKEEEILKFAKQWVHIQSTDTPQRPVERCNGTSGWEQKNQKLTNALRSVGKQILGLMGKKLLSGQLNLTTISFPIRAMIPESALQKALQSLCFFPLYINKAASIDNKVERMKLTITACIANYHYNQGYGKPLNPILGETCQASFADGTQLFSEQISHHPPICYIYGEPKDKSYTFYGNYNYSSAAGMNSLSIVNSGKRNIKFNKDGQLITYNFAKEQYSGVFMGAMKLETKGQLIFKDEENEIEAVIQFETPFPSKNFGDDFCGVIKKEGEVISKISGSYITHIDFDGIRYFDYRNVQPYKLILEQNNMLESDSCYRQDALLMQRGDIQGAQKMKEQLEQFQRNDAKLRKLQNNQNNSNKSLSNGEINVCSSSSIDANNIDEQSTQQQLQQNQQQQEKKKKRIFRKMVLTKKKFKIFIINRNQS